MTQTTLQKKLYIEQHECHTMTKRERTIYISNFPHCQLEYFNTWWGNIYIMGLLLLNVSLQNLVQSGDLLWDQHLRSEQTDSRFIQVKLTTILGVETYLQFGLCSNPVCSEFTAPQCRDLTKSNGKSQTVKIETPNSHIHDHSSSWISTKRHFNQGQ